MKSPLERLCRVLDDILVARGMTTRTAVRLLAANGLAISWRQSQGDGLQERPYQRALVMPQEWANVGMVLVNDWRQRRSQPTHRIHEDVEMITRRRRKRVETVDVLALIAVHQAEIGTQHPVPDAEARRLAVLAQTKKVVSATRPLSLGEKSRPLTN